MDELVRRDVPSFGSKWIADRDGESSCDDEEEPRKRGQKRTKREEEEKTGFEGHLHPPSNLQDYKDGHANALHRLVSCELHSKTGEAKQSLETTFN